MQSKGLSRVFSNTTVQKHQFLGAQPSSQSNSTYSPRMQDIVEPEYKATLRYIVEKKLKLIGEPLAAHAADAREEGTDGSIL